MYTQKAPQQEVIAEFIAPRNKIIKSGWHSAQCNYWPRALEAGLFPHGSRLYQRRSDSGFRVAAVVPSNYPKLKAAGTRIAAIKPF